MSWRPSRALAVSALLLLQAPWPEVSVDAVRSSEFTAQVTATQAAVVALNTVTPIEEGYRLVHPRHVVDFTADGLHFEPRRGGPAWRWQLASVTAGAATVIGVRTGAVAPTAGTAGVVAYDRGGLIERYVPRAGTVEQQFVIPAPLAAGSADLEIVGRVASAGTFESVGDGWVWRATDGQVSLGSVTVFDADARELPAQMTATADRTTIVVDGEALATARYPITVDPEIGTNDFRISDMGVDGAAAAQVSLVDVAYNTTANEYLVVWSADDGTAPMVDGEEEIFGQRIDAATGAEVGPNDFRISDMGPDGDASYDAREPAVAYDPNSDQYLVVWSGDDNTAPLVDNEFEIFGQRLTSNGTAVGVNDFRISDMGPDGDTAFNASTPDVAVVPSALEYLVVWAGDDNTGLLIDEEFEIFGQRINAPSGAPVGTDFRISDMGPDGSPFYAGVGPRVTGNPPALEFLVVWMGTDDSGGLVMREVEIFGQRLVFGAHVGPNDFRISDMGPDGNTNFNALLPDVAYNPTTNEYLVVWQGDDDNLPLVNEEFEIFGQRLGANGAEVGTNDFRISDMGTDGDPNADANRPAVGYDRANNEYFVVWSGDDASGGLVDDELEIFGQALSATGLEIGLNDVRLSDMGLDGNAAVDGDVVEVVYGITPREFLAVWRGDDSTAPLVDEEFEVYGQRFGPAPALPGAPTSLAALINGFNVTLTWNASAVLFRAPDRAAATSYKLEVGSASGLTDITVIPVGNVTNLAAAGPAGTYFVAVRGVNAAGDGPRSNEVVVVLPGGAPPCGAAPGAPTGLTSIINGSNVRLTWTPSFGCAPTSYVIEAGTAAGLVDLALLDTGSTTTTFDAVAVPSGTYFVRVKGRNAIGTGAASNEIVVVVP